jgi:hypothetical protein
MKLLRKPDNPPTQIPPKRNGGLGTLPRLSPVICWYWTKAIALPRVPGIFTLASLPRRDRSYGDTR